MKDKYFYCYSFTLHKFLHYANNMKYICAALNEKTLKKFWLYENTPQLQKLLEEYNSIFKRNDAN